ncbi:MAG: hypothetical protein ACJAU5_000212 [Maricaulis maris]|jgi:hypothetical protein
MVSRKTTASAASAEEVANGAVVRQASAMRLVRIIYLSR